MKRAVLSAVIVAVWGILAVPPQAGAEEEDVLRFARFRVADRVAYGVVEGDAIREIRGDPFGPWQRTDRVHAVEAVQLLVPTEPTQVIAMAGNYRSHLNDAVLAPIGGVAQAAPGGVAQAAPAGAAEVPEKFRIPQPFFKSRSCLVPHGAEIVIPPGTADVHYEAELVVVIGRVAKNVPREQALEYVLGVTCGNDISARDWQANDVQWWRAKGCDTSGPCGPYIVCGIDYDNLLLQLRQNGEVRQRQRTSDLIHDVAAIVSCLSQHLTLQPGDLIFTGTPGETTPIRPGDVLEVDIEHVGVLRNTVAAD